MDGPIHLEIGTFEVVLQDLKLPMGLTVNGLTLTGSDLAIDKEPFSVSSPAPGKLRALLLAENLAAFLNKQAPGGLKDFRVKLADDRLHIEASLMIMKASATCSLRIVEGRTLHVDLDKVDVMGVGARNLVQSQLDKINPVLDVADLPIEAELTGFQITDGKLELFGDVHPTLRK